MSVDEMNKINRVIDSLLYSLLYSYNRKSNI